MDKRRLAMLLFQVPVSSHKIPNQTVEKYFAQIRFLAIRPWDDHDNMFIVSFFLGASG